MFTNDLRDGLCISLICVAWTVIASTTAVVAGVLDGSLVALEPIWTRVLFALLSLILIAANLDTAVRIRAVAKVIPSPALLMNEVLGSVGVLVLVVIPWILGGLHPTREDLAWAILLAFATGFISIIALVLSVFDTAKFEARGPGGERQSPS